MVPEDVMRAAKTALYPYRLDLTDRHDAAAINVARAILAERRRCADVAREQMRVHMGAFGSQPAYVAAHAIAAAIEATPCA